MIAFYVFDITGMTIQLLPNHRTYMFDTDDEN